MVDDVADVVEAGVVVVRFVLVVDELAATVGATEVVAAVVLATAGAERPGDVEARRPVSAAGACAVTVTVIVLAVAG